MYLFIYFKGPPPRCIGGPYNDVQYVLIIFTFIVLVIASLLFHYSFYSKNSKILFIFNYIKQNNINYYIKQIGTSMETFFFSSILVISAFFIIISNTFWINPMSMLFQIFFIVH